MAPEWPARNAQRAMSAVFGRKAGRTELCGLRHRAVKVPEATLVQHAGHEERSGQP
jgi:hypothetical protein